MTSLQQLISHLTLVGLAIAAVVALAVTGNLSTAAEGIILAVTGFGNIGVAGVTPTVAAPKS
jgi:hypothetical protein